MKLFTEKEYNQLFLEQNCLNSTRIRDFLRFSRLISDDTLIQNLNNGHVDCDSYYLEKILPQWKARDSLIQYCSDFAAQYRQIATKSVPLTTSQEPVDLRKDPYAIRNIVNDMDAKFQACDSMDNWIKNESTIESIVHEQSSNILNDKCYYADWLAKFNDYKSNR
jgi:hypothetical protein